MKLSIIVPVYNTVAEERLEFCLNSLTNQMISDYEIIAINDASTDDSLIVLNWYKNHYPNKFKVINLPENRKPGGAKNAGLDIACGDFIGFVDSDDWIENDMFEKLLNKAEETGADVVGCDYYLTWTKSAEDKKVISCGKEEQVGILDDAKYKSLILDSGTLAVKIIKRELFENSPRIRFPEKIFYEDQIIAPRLLLRAKHFEYVKEPLYYHYGHFMTEERCVHRLESMRLMLKLAKEDKSIDKFHDEIEYRFTEQFYMYVLFNYMFDAKRLSVSFIRALGKAMRECFPEFQKNIYYTERVSKEKQKFIALQQKSTLIFIIRYSFVLFVRRIKAWIERRKIKNN